MLDVLKAMDSEQDFPMSVHELAVLLLSAANGVVEMDENPAVEAFDLHVTEGVRIKVDGQWYDLKLTAQAVSDEVMGAR